MEDNNEIDSEDGKDKTSLCLLFSVTDLCDRVCDLSSLSSLIVVGHSVDDLRGIENLKSLEELWLVDANLHQKDIQPLSECPGLKRLYLYGNKLEAIPDFHNLKSLTTLWLSDNRITTFANVDTLSNIREINLANNNITQVDLNENISTVEILNLSGNALRSLSGLKTLAHFKKLQSLYFSDPLCKISTVSLLDNFRVYLISILPSLLILDSKAITDVDRKNAVKYYKETIIYYRLKLHSRVANLYSSAQAELKFMSQEHELIWGALHLHGPQEKTKENNSNYLFWERQANMWRKLSEYNLLKQKQIEIIKKKTVELEVEHSGNILFEELDLSDNVVYERFKQKMDLYVCSHLRRVVDEVDVLDVWSITGTVETITQKLRIEALFDDLYIWHPVQELCEIPLDNIAEYIFQNKLNGSLNVSKCFVNSDPLVSCTSNVHNQLLSLAPTLFRSRLLVLCAVADGDLTTYNENNLQVCPSCSFLTFCKGSTIIPMYLVHFKYKFVDYFKALRGSVPTCLEGETLLPRRIEQQNSNSLTTLILTNIKINSLDLSPMLNITSLDLSFNVFESLSSITCAFPKLVNLNLAFNRIKEVDNIQKLIELNNLVLKWNFISNFEKTVALLKDLKSLKRLNLSNNPFKDLMTKEHEMFFVCSLLSHLNSYNDEPLPRFLNSSKIVVGDSGPFPILPYVHYSNQVPKLMWKSDLGNTNEGNFLGKVDGQIVSLRIRGINMNTFIFESSCSKLKWLNLSSNLITKFSVVKELSRLVEVDLSRNVIATFSTTPNDVFKHLSKLNLSHNYITSLAHFQPQSFPHIKLLDLSYNKIQSLEGIEKLKTLIELYISHNRLKYIDTLSHCNTLKRLKVLDISFNPIASNKNVKETCVYFLGGLEYLNGKKVENDELIVYQGSLDVDYLLRMFSKVNVYYLTTLSLPNCSIKNVQIPPNTLINVTSVCLDNNKIKVLEWIHFLPKVERVSLSHNCVCRHSSEENSEVQCSSLSNNILYSLFLDHNRIKHLIPLHLRLFPQLRLLVLNNNQISYLSGLQNNGNLETLLLDRNKLTSINSEQTKNWGKVGELNVEHNYLTKLDFLSPLINIRRLYLGFNKIVARSSLAPLRELTELRELTLHGNPLMRQVDSYIHYLPFVSSIELLEGHNVYNHE